MENFSPNATKLLNHFHERNLIAADYIISGQLGRVIPDVRECIAAVHELADAGWLMVDPKSAGPVPNVVLSDFGYKMIHRA
jgi:hypothetical protein